MAGEPPLVIVDGANVVGSVPDGWWRDRALAARRLRDQLGPIAAGGLPGGPAGLRPPVEVIMVVEGAARELGSTPQVRVVAARGSGDDTIVDLVGSASPRRLRVVVTSDRVLRERVSRLGALVVGARSLARLRQDRPSPGPG